MTQRTTSFDPVGRAFTVLIVAKLLVGLYDKKISDMDSLDYARLCKKCLAILKQNGVEPQLPQIPGWNYDPLF
jgi:hypothetical protein